MFQQVLNYAGEYRKTTYLSIAVMLSGIIMNVLPFLFLYQLLRPLLTEKLWARSTSWPEFWPSPSAVFSTPFCM